MPERICAVCSGPVTGRRTVVCSSKCRIRRQNQSAAYKATKRRYVAQKSYPITCEQCGQVAGVAKPGCRFCSHECYWVWRDRPVHGPPVPPHVPSTELVHVGPADPRCDLPPQHPARRPAPRRTDWWQFLAGGCCVWCGDTFLALTASVDTMSKFCSKRCLSDAGKYRHGRFVISPKRRRALYERDGWMCQLCGDPVDPDLDSSDPWAATLDHIVCQSWGEAPDHSDGNLRLAHRWCNSVRGDERFYTAADLVA